MRVAPSLLLVPSVLLAGCQPAFYIPPSPPYCEETRTDLSAVDEQAPSGVRAADFLERVSGLRETTLEYQPAPDDESVYVEIERSVDSTPLSIELTPDTASLRWIEAEVVYPEGSEGSPEPLCQSRLELETAVSVSSEDGVLAESFEVTMAAIVDDSGALDFAAVPIAFDPAELSGSFEVLSVTPNAPMPSFIYHEMWIEYPLSEGAPDQLVEPLGYVGGVVEYDFIDYYVLGVFSVGLFGGYEWNEQQSGAQLFAGEPGEHEPRARWLRAPNR